MSSREGFLSDVLQLLAKAFDEIDEMKARLDPSNVNSEVHALYRLKNALESGYGISEKDIRAILLSTGRPEYYPQETFSQESQDNA